MDVAQEEETKKSSRRSKRSKAQKEETNGDAEKENGAEPEEYPQEQVGDTC